VPNDDFAVDMQIFGPDVRWPWGADLFDFSHCRHCSVVY